MKHAQKPAEGILEVRDYGANKIYKIVCQCQDDAHSHNLWVEADELDVTVSIFTQLKTQGMNRWRKIWHLLTKGYIDVEECIYMTRQQALNYSDALKHAVKDVEEFKSKISKLGK